jgi:hypothetical protein
MAELENVPWLLYCRDARAIHLPVGHFSGRRMTRGEERINDRAASGEFCSDIATRIRSLLRRSTDKSTIVTY